MNKTNTILIPYGMIQYYLFQTQNWEGDLRAKPAATLLGIIVV